LGGTKYKTDECSLYPEALLVYKKVKSFSNNFYVLEKDDDFAVFFPLDEQDSLHAFGVPSIQTVVFYDWK